MPSPIHFALFFTVALLVITAYFMMGALPLLILKHDTPLDSRFIRGFFNTYYRAAMFAAAGAAGSYAVWGRPVFALGAAALAVAAVVLRRRIIPTMDHVGALIQTSDAGAVARFRNLHRTAIGVNLTQLVLVVWSLTTFKL